MLSNSCSWSCSGRPTDISVEVMHACVCVGGVDNSFTVFAFGHRRARTFLITPPPPDPAVAHLGQLDVSQTSRPHALLKVCHVLVRWGTTSDRLFWWIRREFSDDCHTISHEMRQRVCSTAISGHVHLASPQLHSSLAFWCFLVFVFLNESRPWHEGEHLVKCWVHMLVHQWLISPQLPASVGKEILHMCRTHRLYKCQLLLF